jgi:hypothetical protein
MSTGLDLTHINADDCTYKACVRGRMEDIPHKWSLVDANTKPYEIIFTDFEGPMPIPGYDGSQYFVTFLDACTKESEVFMMKYKSEVPYCYR